MNKYAISYSVAAVGGRDNGTLTANTVRKNMAVYTNGLSSDAEVYKGSDLTFTAAPDDGYRVQEWRVNDEVYKESGAAFIGTQLVLRGVDEKKTVMVQFMPLGDKITHPPESTAASPAQWRAVRSRLVILPPASHCQKTLPSPSPPSRIPATRWSSGR